MSLAVFPMVLYEAVPYGDRDAFLDFNLVHFLAHVALAQKTKTSIYLLDSLRDDPFPHAQMHKNAAAALGLADAFNFAGYDLNDRSSFQEFMLANSAHHALLQAAAGL